MSNIALYIWTLNDGDDDGDDDDGDDDGDDDDDDDDMLCSSGR